MIGDATMWSPGLTFANMAVVMCSDYLQDTDFE